jgi:hypothetical protein
MAEKRTIELEIKDNSKSLKAQYKEAVAELQKVSAQYGETSKEAVKAARAAAELKDQIGFSKDLVDSFNPDAKFNALSRSIGGVLDGFQAFEGALGLIGVEGEQVQAAMLKVQSAMALSQGIQGVMEAKDSLLQLGTVMKSTAIGQAVLTAATAAYNIVVGTSTGLMKAFRIAMISTGIGALVVGVGLLVANFDKVVNVVKNVIGYFSNLSGTAKNIISVMFPIVGIIRLIAAALEELGIVETEQEKKQRARDEATKKAANNRIYELNKEKNLREKLSKVMEDAYNKQDKAMSREIALLKAQGKDTTALERARLQATIRYQTNLQNETYALYQQNKEKNDLIKTELYAIGVRENDFKAYNKFIGESSAIQKDLAQQNAKANEARLDAVNQLAIFEAEVQKRNAESQSNYNQQSVQSHKETTETKIDISRRLEDESLRIQEEGREKELAALDLKYKRQKEDAEKELKDDKDKVNKLAKLNAQAIESRAADEKIINDKYDKIERDKKIENEEWFKNYEKKLAEEKLQAEIINSENEDAAMQKRNENRIQARFSMLTDEQLQEYNSKKEFNDSLAELDRLKNEGAFKTEEEYLKAVDILQDDYNKKDIARKNELRQKTLDLTAKSFSALAELAGSFNTKNEKDARKQFQVQKAFNLAAAITNTAMAVTGALTAGGNPIKLATGMQFVEAGIAATVGAANIIKISNSKFGGGANSGGGGNDTNVPTAAPMTANFNTIGSSGINQLAQLQQTPTQAYVVSGEVTSAQALDRNRVQNATL